MFEATLERRAAAANHTRVLPLEAWYSACAYSTTLHVCGRLGRLAVHDRTSPISTSGMIVPLDGAPPSCHIERITFKAPNAAFTAARA